MNERVEEIMQILKIILLTLLLTGLQAKAAKWQQLKPMQAYTKSDFHLKESVKCLEFKVCKADVKRKKCEEKPYSVVRICPKASKHLDPKLIKRFKNLSPKASQTDNIRKTILSDSIINGFSIDDKGIIWRLNEIKDIIDILGKIDTPAEAQFVLWLHGRDDGVRYRKVSGGYEVITEHQGSACDGVNDYEEYSSYRLLVGENGKIIKRKLLKHTKKKVQLLKKPAIYLYPLTKQKIDVSLVINGAMILSIPPYNKGWSVMADRNGTIENKYDYLFYENRLKTIELNDEGWIKQGSELNGWFDIILPELGLNSRELEQFKEYWLKELNENKLYEIKLFSLSFLTKNMTLDISPKPDTLIRVMFHFKVIKKRYEIRSPKIITPKRSGFHVLEWGGMVEEER